MLRPENLCSFCFEAAQKEAILKVEMKEGKRKRRDGGKGEREKRGEEKGREGEERERREGWGKRGGYEQRLPMNYAE